MRKQPTDRALSRIHGFALSSKVFYLEILRRRGGKRFLWSESVGFTAAHKSPPVSRHVVDEISHISFVQQREKSTNCFHQKVRLKRGLVAVCHMSSEVLLSRRIFLKRFVAASKVRGNVCPDDSDFSTIPMIIWESHEKEIQQWAGRRPRTFQHGGIRHECVGYDGNF